MSLASLKRTNLHVAGKQANDKGQTRLTRLIGRQTVEVNDVVVSTDEVLRCFVDTGNVFYSPLLVRGNPKKSYRVYLTTAGWLQVVSWADKSERYLRHNRGMPFTDTLARNAYGQSASDLILELENPKERFVGSFSSTRPALDFQKEVQKVVDFDPTMPFWRFVESTVFDPRVRLTQEKINYAALRGQLGMREEHVASSTTETRYGVSTFLAKRASVDAREGLAKPLRQDIQILSGKPAWTSEALVLRLLDHPSVEAAVIIGWMMSHQAYAHGLIDGLYLDKSNTIFNVQIISEEKLKPPRRKPHAKKTVPVGFNRNDGRTVKIALARMRAASRANNFDGWNSCIKLLRRIGVRYRKSLAIILRYAFEKEKWHFDV